MGTSFSALLPSISLLPLLLLTYNRKAIGYTSVTNGMLRTWFSVKKVESVYVRCSIVLFVDSRFCCNLKQKRFSNERIAALLEDRRIREADEDAYRKTMERRVYEQTVNSTTVSRFL